MSGSEGGRPADPAPTKQEPRPAHGGDATPSRPKTTSAWRGQLFAWLSVLVAVVLLGLIAYHARTGAVSPRIRNPEVTGAPRPVGFLFGLDNWVSLLHIFTIVSMTTIVITYVVMWRRHPAHPVLLMGIVCTALVWQDPLGNWSPYAVYNPDLLHWPEDWPWVSLSPTVEPFVVIGYIMFYLAPYFPAIWLLQKIQARRPVDSFVWRHPLICLAALIFPIGFVFDMFLEVSLIRTGMYIYSQVIPFGSIFTGTTFQFPLIWESALVTVVMIPAGVLLYRDDTGRTVAEKLAQRARIFATRPTLGTFVVMLIILNISYGLYVFGFTVIRWTGTATSVACPYPYPEAKVFDPQGFYAKNGAPGPYFRGIAPDFMTWQPDHRPEAPAAGGRCAQK